jgi:hypothetical protein
MADNTKTLLIACGALAREVTTLIHTNKWDHMVVTCLPAHLHNRPEKIPEAVRAKIRSGRRLYDHILVLYGDCGTGGLLDKVLAEEGVERIPGPHCYEFYTGVADFSALSEAEPGTFFLTDYLVRHFDRLIIKGLGLDRYPQLLGDYFGNYRLLVHLAQTEDAALRIKAQAAAERLELGFEYRFTGLQGLGQFLEETRISEDEDGQPRHRLLA